jgi:hypothetical protein
LSVRVVFVALPAFALVEGSFEGVAGREGSPVHASGTSVEFWTTDETLRAAAIAEGLRVVVPQ